MATKKAKTTSRKRATAAAAPPPEEPPAEQPARESITPKKLKSLLASSKTTMKEISSLTGTLREEIANAVQNNHLNAKVFGTIKMLYRLEAEKLADWRETFLNYMEISGLNKRADQVVRMQFGPGPGAEAEAGEEAGGAEEEEAEPEPATTGRNVRAFPRPQSVAAE